MTMMIPMRRQRNLVSELMGDPFEAFFNAPSFSNKLVPAQMKTDIKELSQGFELSCDLPGFKRENVSVELKDGYLKVSATTASESEENGEAGTYVRKERFTGTCSRTFYVGEDIESDDIKAQFADGVLSISIPKKQEVPEQDSVKHILIS